MSSIKQKAQTHDRRSVMALLARATQEELSLPLARRWPDLRVHELKAAEAGLAMVRGRIGGDGAPFNLGEASVTRCVVEIEGGARGYAFVLGRDRAKARAAAILDALWQTPDGRALVEQDVLRPVSERLSRQAARDMAQTAATRVDFFTMVRGDPAA